MAKIEFRKLDKSSYFLDPNDDYSKKTIYFEVRKDPLTDQVSRILPYRRKFAELTIPSDKIEESRKVCPFCPEKISSSTPKLLPEIAPEGRVKMGKATLIPNSFPYAQYNLLVIFSEEHFIYLDQFDLELLINAFLLAQDGLKRLRRCYKDINFSSINWNYLPPAGGAIYHPHLHIVAEDNPTLYHQKVIEGLKRYKEKEGTPFWEDFLKEEIEKKERYIGQQGDVHFLTAFAPKGIFGEIIILFPKRNLIEDMDHEDFKDFSKGLIKIFRYLKGHTVSFNLSLFSGNPNNNESWVYGRLCPRMLVPPWNTSDINFFEKLHQEVMCTVSPEELCQDLRDLFNKSDSESQ